MYAAPADLHIRRQLAKVPLRIHLGLYQDETAVLCDWHIPEVHYLESWSDARAYDGTAGVIQPLIAPLFGGRSAHELLAALGESAERDGLEIVREHWRGWWQKQEHKEPGSFELFWQRSLQEGLVAGSKFGPVAPKLEGWAERVAKAQRGEPGTPVSGAGKLEIVFRPDPTLFDGRFANNGWLQELPKPVTKLTWDNAALMSPTTARELGIAFVPGSSARFSSTGGEHGQAIVDVVELTYRGRTVEAPVWIQPGHADGAVTLHLGHGRQHAGQVADGVGFNAYALRTSEAPWFGGGLEARKLPAEEHCAGLHPDAPQHGGTASHSHGLTGTVPEESALCPRFAGSGSAEERRA